MQALRSAPDIDGQPKACRSSGNCGRVPFVLTGPPYGQQIWVKWTTLVLVMPTNSFNGTLHETSGVRFDALLRIADFYAIAPNRLEAHGADYNSTEAYRLYTIA